MIEESKYCSEVMKKHFKEELVMTKEDNEDFKISTKSWICDNGDKDVKVRDHSHITICSEYIDCNINLKLYRKIAIKFHNVKNYHSHLILQELDKFNLKINITLDGLEKYTSFTINNKLSLINCF